MSLVYEDPNMGAWRLIETLMWRFVSLHPKSTKEEQLKYRDKLFTMKIGELCQEWDDGKNANSII